MAVIQVSTHITIVNFEKYNPRKDVKNPSWFRLEHSLFDNPDFYDLNHIEKLAWVYLLCVASKKNSESFTLSWPHVEKIGGFKHKDFLQALEKLQAIQVVHVDVTDASRARHVDVTDAYATNERTDETNETDLPSDSVSPLKTNDIMTIWNSNTVGLPKARIMTEDRRKQAKSQIEKYPDRQHWTDALVKFTNSTFCLQQWKPDIDDFLDEEKRTRALEGRYDDNAPKNTTEQGEWFGPTEPNYLPHVRPSAAR